MNYWLLKTEAEEFSIEDLAKKKREPWSGVRNFVARNHLKAMSEGDLALLYHTGDQKAVVGIAKIVKSAYPDPTQFEKKSHYYDPSSTKEKPKWYLVDVAFVRKLKRPVTLAEIKIDPALSGMVLTKAPRLSVQPVSKKDFEYIVEKLGSATKGLF